MKATAVGDIRHLNKHCCIAVIRSNSYSTGLSPDNITKDDSYIVILSF